MERVDSIVLGAGPSGLGAGLALARAGASVMVVEASGRVGGLCVTERRDAFAFDIGGHIPFVNDDTRVQWLKKLLGDDLLWVDRPVSCVIDGRITPGRYLDRRPDGAVEPTPEDGSAFGELGSRFGGEFTNRAMRAYLEKIDGVPLERIPGPRAIKLLVEQAAPEGFWFPRHGIGQLMEAMAREIAAAGGEVLLETRATEIDVTDGRVQSVTLDDGRTVATDALVASIPSALAARMARPAAPAEATRDVEMRAVCIVYLGIDRECVSDQPWVQVDDPAVPFSRAFEPRNWSRDLSPSGQTMLGLECYCSAERKDPVWGLSDDELAKTCQAALVERLGWLDPGDAVRLVQLVRLPRAYPAPDLDQWPAVIAPGQWLTTITGLHLAPGAAVIEAIEQGEKAADEILATARLAA